MGQVMVSMKSYLLRAFWTHLGLIGDGDDE